MANTTLTFNETTYEFLFDAGIDTIEDYRERYKIFINGDDTNKLLLVSTEKIDGVIVENPQNQKYELLIPSNVIIDGVRVSYRTPYKQYYTAGLPFEIVCSIIKEVNKK